MKPTQIAELFANIKASFVSFFSILMFVALAAGVFAGIYWTSFALENAAEKQLEQGQMHHFQITYPYGLTDGDLEKLRALDGVDQVEALRVSYQTYEDQSRAYQVRVQSLGGGIDQLTVLEGELPGKAGEIVLWENSAELLGLGVGDTIAFDPDGANGTDMKFLSERVFRITGVVQSPEYISSSQTATGYGPDGHVDAVAWTAPESFDGDAFKDGYPMVNVWSDELAQMSTFSKPYEARSAEIEAELVSLGEQLSKERNDGLRADAQAQLDEGESQLDDAKAQADDAQAQLDEGEQALEEKKSELEEGKRQVEDGQAQLDAARQQIAEAEVALDAAYDKLTAGEQRYDEAASGIEEAESALGALTDAVNNERSIQGQLDADLANTTDWLNQQLDNDEVAPEQYDAMLAEATSQYDSEIAASNQRIDAACNEAAGEFLRQAGRGFPTAIDHTNVDDAIVVASEALARSYDMPIEIDGETITLSEARVKLDEGWQEYDAGLAQLEAIRAQEAEAETQLEAGKQALEEGEKQLESGQGQLDDAEAELASGREQIDEKSNELEAARASLQEMAQYDWTVLSRSYNGSVLEVMTFSNMTNRLAFSMAGLFVLVGLLVSYSAVSRLVREQITQIGTKKALGLRGKEITASFILYSGIAVIAGIVVGLIVGVLVVEGIIGNAVGDRFVMGAFPPYFGLPLSLAFTALELVLVLGTTWLACRSILRKHAVDLLRGPEPPSAKERFYEKWDVWKKLPLLTQTIVSNCANDKRRVFSTIVGVAGCTALIVTAITLNDDVIESYDRQYRNVYLFNGMAQLDPDDDNAAADAQAAFDEEGIPAVQVRRQMCTVTKPDGSRDAMNVVAPLDVESFSQVYHVESVAGGDGDLGEQGVWVSRAYADHTGAKVGDDLVFDIGDGKKYTAPIVGFYDFYLTYYEIVVGPETYRSLTGEYPQANTLFVDTGDQSVEQVNELMSGKPGIKSLIDDKYIQGENFRSFSSVSRVVVLVYIALAVLMSAIVLLNLNHTFIDEKKRELIVLMINGFSAKDAKRYIYNDTIALTVIGILAGLVFGGIMGAITVWTIEPASAHFFKGIALRAMAVGAVGSAVLSLIMCLIALRRIPRFSLTDINKF